MTWVVKKNHKDYLYLHTSIYKIELKIMIKINIII